MPLRALTGFRGLGLCPHPEGSVSSGPDEDSNSSTSSAGSFTEDGTELRGTGHLTSWAWFSVHTPTGRRRRSPAGYYESPLCPCGLRARSLGCGVSQHVCVQCLCLRGQEGPRGAVGAAGSGGRSPYEPADTPALGPSHSRGQRTMRQAPNPLRGQRKRVTLLQPDVKSPLTSTSSLGPKSRMTWEGICFY